MTTQTPNAAVGYLFFEDALRKFLAERLRELSLRGTGPENVFIDEMFARFGDDVRLQVKKWFATTTNIDVVINYPKDDTHVPFIAVVNSRESEATQQTYLGDDGGILYQGAASVESASQETVRTLYGEVPVPDPRPRALQARQLVSIPENRALSLYIATDDPNSTMYLYYIVKALIITHKLLFDRFFGVRNMRLSGADLQHRPELFPQFVYMKVITLEYESNFDVALSPKTTIAGAELSLSTFSGS